MIETTPGLVINGKEVHYLERFKQEFEIDNRITIPENPDKPLIVYTNQDKNISHIWRGGGYVGLREEDFSFDEPKFRRRAQRILWIRYILENPSLREIYRDKNNGYICFVSRELEYTVVLRELKTNFLLITAYHTYDVFSYMNRDQRFERIYSI